MERLVLFDIDCTLIDGHGAGTRAILRAVREVYGAEGDLGAYSFHGRTDPAIVRDIVALWSTGDDALAQTIEDRLPDCLTRYVELLEHEISVGHVEVLPGVQALITALAADRRTIVGLLTGNVEPGARLKLAPTELLPHFRVAAYGSDSEKRPDLPAIAVERARSLTGHRFAGKEIVIIGDTPADITCGADLGVRTIAVATGRYTVADLIAHQPDYVFADMGEWQAVYNAILA
ncbi:MAG: HAD hydrolase-like protein [Thermoleophilia bacterium]